MSLLYRPPRDLVPAINVGIIGAGDFGARHARVLKKLENARLVAASRTNPRALDEFAKQFDCQGYTDYRDLLADDVVDAVVIATPHHLHTDIVKAAAKAGKHILLEKPMAPTLRECDEMLRAVRQTGVGLMVGHTSHFVPAYRAAKAVLESGDLGDVVHARSTMTRPWMTHNRRDWHLERATGGGMWLTIGVHVLDQLTWLAGSRVKSLSAELQTRFHDQQADDMGLAFLRYENGVVATATAIGYRTGVFTFVTELTCTKGLLRIDHARGVFIGRDEIWRAVPNSASDDWMTEALLSEWRAFVAALVSGGRMPVTGEYARHVMAVAFAAEASSKQKREVVV